jgi:hypothetical protein
LNTDTLAIRSNPSCREKWLKIKELINPDLAAIVAGDLRPICMLHSPIVAQEIITDVAHLCVNQITFHSTQSKGSTRLNFITFNSILIVSTGLLSIMIN